VARILVVDDEPDVADIVAIVLRKAAHEVDIVDSGTAALDRLETERYDLIVCDLVMPGVNGMAVYEAVERRPEPRPRMLFLSGYYDAGGYEDFLERTKAPVVPKPFDFAALPEAVARVLGP
jgi:two-component system NtrC family sensor kinase